MGDPENGGEPITAEGLRALRAEVEDLEGRGRREMAERIKAADRAAQNWSGTSFEDASESVAPACGAAAAGASSGQWAR